MKAQDLKNSILQLAIQGKLVAQDENDEPVEVLYAKIQAEKQKLIKEGKIKKKKKKPLPPITKDEIPFPIPPTWKWVRLGEIANINGGYAFKSTLYKDKGIRVIRISDFDEQGFKNDKIVRYEYSSELEQYLIENNNIIMAMTGGTVGKSYYVQEIPERLVSNQRVATIKITCNINPRYINYVVLSSIIQADIQSSKNSTNDNISMDLIKNFRIPLPPLEEQKRIVAKIEELEPLINQYDQAEQELSTLNDKFPDQLKKSILQYAIQGKLVSQDENDEPAEVLYAKIQTEKQKLIKEGKIKKDKPLPPITEDEIPFSIPPTWKWVQLNDVCLQITDGEHSTPKRTIVKEIPLLTAKNIRDGYITYDNVDYVLEETAVDCWKRCCPENQDILMTCVGYIGRSSIVSDSRRFVLVRSVSLIRASKILDISFLKLALDSPELQKQMAINTKQTAQPCLYLNKIKSLYFPLPPLEEQHRIVAKVNELIAGYNKLIKLI